MATIEDMAYQDNMAQLTKLKTHIAYCGQCGEYGHTLPGKTCNLYSYDYFRHKDCGGSICASKTVTHDMLDNLSFDQQLELHQEISHTIQAHKQASGSIDQTILKHVKTVLSAHNDGRPFKPMLDCHRSRLNDPTGVPYCPQCDSLLVQPIRAKKRLFSVGLFGMASDTVGKSMECLSCKYKW